MDSGHALITLDPYCQIRGGVRSVAKKTERFSRFQKREINFRFALGNDLSSYAKVQKRKEKRKYLILVSDPRESVLSTRICCYACSDMIIFAIIIIITNFDQIDSSH